MVAKSYPLGFSTSLSYFSDKIECNRCNPAKKMNENFYLCAECRSYFAKKALVGFIDIEKDNGAFNFLLLIDSDRVIRAKRLGKFGRSYDPFLVDFLTFSFDKFI